MPPWAITAAIGMIGSLLAVNGWFIRRLVNTLDEAVEQVGTQSTIIAAQGADIRALGEKVTKLTELKDEVFKLRERVGIIEYQLHPGNSVRGSMSSN